MRFTDHLPGVAVAIGILILCIPIAFIATILSAPFWSWFETRFGFEAYGHSGPADWCYLVTYGVLVAVSIYIWIRVAAPNST